MDLAVRLSKDSNTQPVTRENPTGTRLDINGGHTARMIINIERLADMEWMPGVLPIYKSPITAGLQTKI
tara:strand:- start:430 stop:636 length:207 start_codon:yes stop_codon:yes gene_type:complete